MATSPNYAWAEPDNSSLVKNGASDIRTLGDAIDTSVWNVGYGQAGKNKIINGNFGVWQRGTSFTEAYFAALNTYTTDRFYILANATPTSVTVSQQTFTPGAAPVAGYEGSFFYRSSITTVGSTTTWTTAQRIEDVRTFAGQTVTLSFWAKADSARTITLDIQQRFGTGGSANVTTSAGTISATTAWVRYSATVTLPSITGKTIGTSSNLEVRITQPSASGSVMDLWGVQLEYGSKATPFQTATGTIQGELAACQRYYYRNTAGVAYARFGQGQNDGTTACYVQVQLPVTMRVAPTAIEYANLALHDGTGVVTLTSVTLNSSNPNVPMVQTGGSSTLVTKYTSSLIANNNSAAYLAFTSEL